MKNITNFIKSLNHEWKQFKYKFAGWISPELKRDRNRAYCMYIYLKQVKELGGESEIIVDWVVDRCDLLTMPVDQRYRYSDMPTLRHKVMKERQKQYEEWRRITTSNVISSNTR